MSVFIRNEDLNYKNYELSDQTNLASIRHHVIQNFKNPIANWINERDYKFYITLTFKPYIRRDKEEILKLFIRHLNKKYDRKKKRISGYVIKEKQCNTNIHYHIILEDSEFLRKVSLTDFRDSVKKIMNKFEECIKGIYNDKKITDVNKCVWVDEIDNKEGLTNYSLKDIYNYRTLDNISFIHNNDVTIVSDSH